MLPARRLNGQYGLTDFFNDFFDSHPLERVGVSSPAINVKENDKGYKIEVALQECARTISRYTSTRMEIL